MRKQVRVDRSAVLAYRIAANELQRGDVKPADLAVTALGVQDTPTGTARLALAARTTASLEDDRLALVWSTRGAPHLHRRADLPAIAAALWPLSDADARSRITSGKIREGARLGLAAFQVTADAIGSVVAAPMAKGAVSGAVTAIIPPSLTFWCETCGSQHLSGALFQQVGLAGGTQLVPGASGTTLAPIDGWSGPPTAAKGTAKLIMTYLRLLGPATDTETAKFLGTTRTELRAVWPSKGLVEVTVDGRTGWLPEDSLPALQQPPAPPDVRLLPAGDPFLQARDRDLLVPDKAQHAEVWKILGNPGALLADGDIAGTWRAKLAKKTLEVTVKPFEPLPSQLQRAVTEESARIATARGVDDVRVVIND
jgi:hypothetical protein